MPPQTWPAAELDPRWPHADPGLAAWRYRRILAVIDEHEASYRRHPMGRREGTPPQEWDVSIAVPVAPGWRARPGQTELDAYGCRGELLSGVATEGTVLAVFPLVALRRSVRERLRALRDRREGHRESRAAA